MAQPLGKIKSPRQTGMANESEGESDRIWLRKGNSPHVEANKIINEFY